MRASPFGPNRRWWILVNMTGSLSMITVNQTGISVALPTIRHELHVSTTGVEWVVNAYVLALGSLVAVGGRLGDRFGRTTMFVLGIVVFAIAAGAAGLARGESMLVIARAIQGAGAAMMQPSSTTTVIDTFGEGERGRAMAIYIGVSSAFVAVGPLLGGALTEFVSWRTVFLLNLPIAIAALGLTAIVRPANHPDPERKLDAGGAVLLTVGLAALVVAIQEGDTWGWSSAATLGALAAGILALAALFVFERRSPEPLLDLEQFRDPHYGVGSLVTAAVRFGLLGITVFTTIFIQNTLGFSPFDSGLAIMPVVLALIVGTQLSGRIFDRIGARALLAAGTALIGLGLAVTAPVLASNSYPPMLPGLLVVGFGMGLCSVAVTEALSHVEAARRGQASGMLQTTRQLGGSLGVAAIGAVYAASGLGPAFLVGAAALGGTFLAVIFWLPRRRPRPREHAHEAAAP